MHDAYRVDKGGAPTSGKVLAAAKLLQEHDVEFNILTTVHAANADHGLELYRYMRDVVGTSSSSSSPSSSVTMIPASSREAISRIVQSAASNMVVPD
jgi:sulfatase maturation enzyme AslB (radical SAM superfamily)